MYAHAHAHACAHICSYVDPAAITQAGTHLYIRGNRLKTYAFDMWLWSFSPLKMAVCFLSRGTWPWLRDDALAHATLASTELGRQVGL